MTKALYFEPPTAEPLYTEIVPYNYPHNNSLVSLQYTSSSN